MGTSGYSKAKLVPAALTVALGLALVAGISACRDDPTQPLETGEEAVLRPGVNVYMTLSDDAAAPGSRIAVTGKVRALGVQLTPTGFLVDLRYDAEKLMPLEAVTLEDGVLRAINLEAGAGLVKVAGAAASGLDGDVLFAIEMEVVADGYAKGLKLDVHELTVVEKNFMDVAAQVVKPNPAVVLAR